MLILMTASATSGLHPAPSQIIILVSTIFIILFIASGAVHSLELLQPGSFLRPNAEDCAFDALRLTSTPEFLWPEQCRLHFFDSFYFVLVSCGSSPLIDLPACYHWMPHLTSGHHCHHWLWRHCACDCCRTYTHPCSHCMYVAVVTGRRFVVPHFPLRLRCAPSHFLCFVSCHHCSTIHAGTAGVWSSVEPHVQIIALLQALPW